MISGDVYVLVDESVLDVDDGAAAAAVDGDLDDGAGYYGDDAAVYEMDVSVDGYAVQHYQC